ncbi:MULTISPECIES: DUF1996 domain-containing protein [Streptomyces]|uniref:DUF1996 domain-containing protein n=1 Tax=Streptomyces tsukubensis (strain DSM 42081 / NBRC 108919 / NRRL 18488 / 9993) TaxID=1114943 RepID=I2MX83_STRT9|nr:MULTISPECIES: DUF1996 domain-containing protein [Streptomyces]AZK93767.1 hypothetical protein B7R87_07675 [Streptomyces tsukubensis]EIF89380.1 hypothetical protein [Streptomyces tsukubensis NRRL18488]MYS68495.1 DUF1996 domain-containing protein [Streptomyces sp. SID5473]QKM70095.1 DUF1996 domain-containing protein [Streptomyces tsukubensis NRRL18488]TAI45929.1 DUF1996 domain-containing protein [Streptomyces tsukubensis]
MRRNRRKRSRPAVRAVVAVAALVLGGGGVVLVDVYASAGQDGVNRRGPGQAADAAPVASTIDCPEVADGLPGTLPPAARPAVDRELAAMDTRITEAYRQFAERRERYGQDAGLAQKELLGPLQEQRRAGIERIVTAVNRGGLRFDGMRDLAACTLRADDGNDRGTDGRPGNSNGNGNESGNGGGGGQAGNGPVRSDFTDIRSVRPNAQLPPNRRGASRGVFTTDCGVNANGLFNSDNVIVAPGVSNGAHHMHDYIGNQANNAFASDRDLANGATTCRNRGDRSSYYWPVLRLQNGRSESDADADGGGRDKNVGEIQTPAQVTLDFVGNPNGPVTAMPRLLRIITGDAKAFVNGPANANASWSCTGFEDRQLKEKYPLCPRGSRVVRTFRFQSCWDGRNTDSANHRTHVAFTDRAGRCPRGFRPVPQLVQRIVYSLPPGPGFAVDSFPEQLHKPVTDHGDFINVFDDGLMRRMVACINEGRRCR